MNTDQIKRELANRGYDYSMLAAAIGKSPSLVSKVAGRKARSKEVALALAKVIEQPIEAVFPDIEAYHYTDQQSLRKARQESLTKILNK